MAFIFISVDTKAENEIIKALKETPGVENVYSLYGIYDLVVRIKTETMPELKYVINSKVRKLKKIKSTLTMIVV